MSQVTQRGGIIQSLESKPAIEVVHAKPRWKKCSDSLQIAISYTG